MKVNKRVLESVDADSDIGRIICCALYLNGKAKAGEADGSLHEQVAHEILRGNYVIETIARVTHMEQVIVQNVLREIVAMCGIGW